MRRSIQNKALVRGFQHYPNPRGLHERDGVPSGDVDDANEGTACDRPIRGVEEDCLS